MITVQTEEVGAYTDDNAMKASHNNHFYISSSEEAIGKGKLGSPVFVKNVDPEDEGEFGYRSSQNKSNTALL